MRGFIKTKPFAACVLWLWKGPPPLLGPFLLVNLVVDFAKVLKDYYPKSMPRTAGALFSSRLWGLTPVYDINYYYRASIHPSRRRFEESPAPSPDNPTLRGQFFDFVSTPAYQWSLSVTAISRFGGTKRVPCPDISVCRNYQVLSSYLFSVMPPSASRYTWLVLFYQGSIKH